MTDDRKGVIARSGILVFMIALGLRILQTTVGDAPIATAAGTIISGTRTPPPTEAHLASGKTTSPSGTTTFVRLEWLNHCDPVKTQLGLYTATDAPCRPSRAVSLNWLQSQLTAAGVLASGEFLERASNTADPACLAAVLSGPTAAPAGWLCSDAGGLYRADPSGRAPDGRLQLWIQGS